MKKNLLFGFFLSFSLLSQAQIQYNDSAFQTGTDVLGRSYGVSLGDYDGDGDDDLYVARHKASTGDSHVLLQCRSSGVFVDITEDVGLTYIGTPHQGIWGDIDNDGDLDLYIICRDESNLLYRNEGGSFTDISTTAGINAYNRAAKAGMMADVNNDGLIDLYVANLYTDNELWINNGDGTFTDETLARGVNDNQIAMGSVFLDYDNDGDQDLYLTHDGNQPYILLENNGDGYFTDVSEASGTNYAGQGMGVDVADVNNDGWMDIYITNLSDNTLFVNNGDKTFADVSQESMTTDPGMGWGAAFTDIDNDGLRDIYMANDSYFSPNPNRLYRNTGDYIFEDVSEGTIMESMFGGYGVACGDFNNDGREDIFLANSGMNDANQLFVNSTQNDNNYVKVRLKGTTSNGAAIGGKVTLSVAGNTYADEVTAGMSYAASSSLTLHFGLGTAEMIDEMRVDFPGGESMTFTDLEVNRTYFITEGENITTNTDNLPTVVNTWSVIPNILSESTQINLDLKERADINLSLTDLRGQVVNNIYTGELDSGVQTFNLARKGLAAGIYFVHLSVNGNTSVKKLLIQ